MRLPHAFMTTAIAASVFSTGALAHSGPHAHSHHADAIGAGLAALLLLATTVVATRLQRAVRAVRIRRDTRR